MERKKWWKSRTLQFAVLKAVAGVLTIILAENPELNAVGGIAFVSSIIDMVLRANTTRGLHQ